MKFTYKSYEKLIKKLQDLDYKFCFYSEIGKSKKTVIMRHDVDFDLDKAVKMAILENEMGVKSTYFILLSTDFYNIFSKSSFEKINKIASMGHQIGLHFDEKRYKIECIQDIEKYVEFESSVLENLIKKKVEVVSMHRPSKYILDAGLELSGMINSYSQRYFKQMNYLSDSRMNWQQNVFDIIGKSECMEMHILTHPFWYDIEQEDIGYKLNKFMNNAVNERYECINENIRNFEEILSGEGAGRC